MNMIGNFWRQGFLLLQEPRWRRLLLALMVIMGLSIALWTITRDWHNLVNYHWQFNWVYLVLSSGAYAASQALTIISWATVMHALNVRVSWKQNARFYMYSWMARRLPTAAPFVVSRVMLYEQEGVDKRITLSGILWEQILLIASGGVLVVLMFPFTPLLSNNIPLLPVALVAVVSVFMIARPSVVTGSINWLLRRWGKEPLTSFLGLRATIGVFVLHTLLWIMGGLILFLLVRSIYVIDMSMLPMVIQIWAVTGLVSHLAFLIPISLGLSDISLVVLLALILPPSMAMIILLMVRVWISLHELFWAMVFSKV